MDGELKDFTIAVVVDLEAYDFEDAARRFLDNGMTDREITVYELQEGDPVVEAILTLKAPLQQFLVGRGGEVEPMRGPENVGG
jgi:hypothetical protein